MNNKKMVMFGTSETLSGLAKEALERGYQVTVVLPDDKEFNLNYSNLKIANGDVKRKEDMVKYSRGSDVIICVCNPSDSISGEYTNTTRVIIDGLKDAGVNNIVYATHIDLLKEKLKRSKEEAQEPEHPVFYGKSTSQQLSEIKSQENIHKEAIKILQSEKGLNWGYAYSGKSGNKSDVATKKEVRYSHADGEKILSARHYISSIIDEAEKEEVNVQDKEYKDKKN